MRRGGGRDIHHKRRGEQMEWREKGDASIQKVLDNTQGTHGAHGRMDAGNAETQGTQDTQGRRGASSKIQACPFFSHCLVLTTSHSYTSLTISFLTSFFLLHLSLSSLPLNKQSDKQQNGNLT